MDQSSLSGQLMRHAPHERHLFLPYYLLEISHHLQNDDFAIRHCHRSPYKSTEIMLQFHENPSGIFSTQGIVQVRTVSRKKQRAPHLFDMKDIVARLSYAHHNIIMGCALFFAGDCGLAGIIDILFQIKYPQPKHIRVISHLLHLSFFFSHFIPFHFRFTRVSTIWDRFVSEYNLVKKVSKGSSCCMIAYIQSSSGKDRRDEEIILYNHASQKSYHYCMLQLFPQRFLRRLY